MFDRKASNKLYDGRTVNEFLNSEPAHEDNTTYLHEAADTVKNGVTAGVFGKMSTGVLKKLAMMITAPFTFIDGVIDELLKFRLFRKFATNKNLDRIETVTSDFASVALDAAALVTEVATSLAISPFLYIGIATLGLINAVPRFIYYGLQLGDYYIGNKRHNRFTEDFKDVKNKFLEKSKDLVAALLGAAAIGVLIAVPALLGATAISALATKITGLTIASVIGGFVTVSLAKLTGLADWIKNKFTHTKTTEEKQEETVEQPHIEPSKTNNNRETEVYRKAAVKYVNVYRCLNGSSTLIAQRLEGSPRPAPRNAPKLEDLDALDYNYKDLIKEMDAFSDADPTKSKSDNAKEYMHALIQEESFKVGDDPFKQTALSRLWDLVDGKQFVIFEKKYKTNSDGKQIVLSEEKYKINSLRDLISYYQQKHKTQTLFRSWFRSISDMQKVFSIAEHYFNTYKQEDNAPAPVPPPRMSIRK